MTAGAVKNRLTAMLAGTSNGEKLPVYIVFNGAFNNAATTNPKKNTVQFEISNAKQFGYPTKNVVYTTQESGWFDDRVTLDWADKVVFI